MKNNIALVMIVKDESKCIQRCLESVKPYINYYVICDTGSTDNTVEIILNTLKDIPGEIVYKNWENFEINRNFALDCAINKSEYIFTIDADEYILENTSLPKLDKDLYSINMLYGNIIYDRVCLFKNNKKYRYKGAVHTYLNTNNENYYPLDNFYIKVTNEGARASNPNKYKKNAELLEEIIKTDYSPRNIFYLAESYKDSKQYDKAIENYVKRFNITEGYEDERYLSLINIGKILEYKLEDIEYISSFYLKAYNLFPKRNEALYYLTSLYRRNKMYDKAYLFGKLSLDKPIPKHSLFLEINAYSWQILDELSVAAYYVGDIDLFKKLINCILNNFELDEENLKRIKNNSNLIKN